MVATASNFFSAFFVNKHLPRAADLEKRVAFPDIDGIVTPDAFEVHNVLEVPTSYAPSEGSHDLG